MKLSQSSITDPMSDEISIKAIKQYESKTIKVIKDFYKRNEKLLVSQFENKWKPRKTANEKSRLQTMKYNLIETLQDYKEKLDEYYVKLYSEFKSTGNSKKINSVFNAQNLKTSYETKLKRLYKEYDNKYNSHLRQYEKVDDKIDMLKEHKNYYRNKKNYQNKKR